MLCLKAGTDASWAKEALADLDAVLVDHAHCEMKAASNALSLAARHPGRHATVQALTELAREEIDHFQRVLALLDARGLALGDPRVDAYAAALRAATTRVPRPHALPVAVDRLLVGALIEARSCERFKLLIDELEANGPEDVRALYTELFPAEARHYRTFVELAVAEASGDEASVRARLDVLAGEEARIVAELAARGERAAIHG